MLNSHYLGIISKQNGSLKRSSNDKCLSIRNKSHCIHSEVFKVKHSLMLRAVRLKTYKLSAKCTQNIFYQIELNRRGCTWALFKRGKTDILLSSFS